MKLIWSMLLLLASLSSFAQTSTIVIVSPRLPVDCAINNGSLVNWIYELDTVREDSEEAVIQFKTQYGQCINGRTQPYIIETGRASAFALETKFKWPWQKDGVSTSIAHTTNAEVTVTMTFKKRILFKKRDQNLLAFYFQPGLQGPSRIYFDNWGRAQVFPTYFQFPWNIELYLDGEEDGNNLLRVNFR